LLRPSPARKKGGERLGDEAGQFPLDRFPLDVAMAGDITWLLRLFCYVSNQDMPQEATVGVTNIYLETGENLWRGRGID
jgi:hypothetical protein